MKNKFFIYIVLILSIFLFACEKEIEFSGNDVKTKLVLNGLLAPDSMVKINLSGSRFFLNDDSFKIINNATVDLWKDGIKIENLSNVGNGYYESAYIIETGDNIQIKASCDGFESIECSTKIVPSTPIISADTINFKEEKLYYSYQLSENGVYETDSSSYYLLTNFNIEITFADLINIHNYYTIKVNMIYYFSNGDSLSTDIKYDSDDLVFQTGNKQLSFLEDVDNIKSFYFSDELFDGKKYTLKLKANSQGGIYVGNNQYEPDVENPPITGKKISVELQSLSYDYYLYMKTLEAKSTMSKFMESFSEPVQIYTNVNGGIGILGSYASSVYTIPLE